MLLSAVSVLVVAQSSSEIPDGLMNNPVLGLLSVYEVTFDVMCYVACTRVTTNGPLYVEVC